MNDVNTLTAELMLTQAEVQSLSEANAALSERLADAEAENRKQEAALRLQMEEEGHYRLYVRYRDQRDEYADLLAQALNAVTIEEDRTALAEEKLAFLNQQILDLYENLQTAKEEAWAEGHAAGRDYQADGWNSDTHDPVKDNPYKKEDLDELSGIS